jgi:ParB family chromosome partitioning protein
MTALGRGLASLIPKRDMSAQELLRRVDDEELDLEGEDGEEAELKKPVAEVRSQRRVNVVDEEREEYVAMPPKPLTTPIPLAQDMLQQEVVAPVKEKSKVNNEMARKHEEQVVQVEVKDITINLLQPRQEFDPVALDELKASIASHGILQPLVLMRLPQSGKYELIAGERRLRAAKELGWTEVPCVVRKGVRTDRNQLEMALVENLQRRDLNPIETALAFKKLAMEYGLSHEEIAQHVGVSRAAITNTMRLLQLPDEVQQGLIDGKMTTAHARAILMIPDAEKQIKFYQQIIRDRVSVRQAEVRARRVRRAMNITDRRREKGSTRANLAKQWTAPLEEKFGSLARVRFLPAKNRFEVVFVAFTEEELNGLVDKLITGKKDESIAEILAVSDEGDDEGEGEE